MTARRFFTLDVFTDTALAGNPLAVVLDADGLDDGRMQAIAREFNLSETVFVCPPANPAHRAALRIFTPARELPFAGHPTVGTAVLLAQLDGRGDTGSFILEEKVGLVPCRTARTRDGQTATFDLPRLPVELDPARSPSAVAAAIGLTPADIGCDGHTPTIYSAGNGFTFIPVRDLEALAAARPVMEHWSAGIAPADHPDAFVYTTRTGETGMYARARMFAPDMGIAEDPATGSAVAAFAGVVMRFDPPARDGSTPLLIGQGFEMGRPSLITLTLDVEAGNLRRASIGGSAVILSEGKLFA